MNRHYLKVSDPIRIAELSVPYFNAAGVRTSPDARGLEFLAAAMAMATSSVDRLDQIPARVGFLFDYSPERTLADPQVREEMRAAQSRRVVGALAEELAKAPRLDRDRFRALAGEVKARTDQKGRALFHPIRVALTGRAEGPELDLAIPTIDRGAELPPEAGVPRVLGSMCCNDQHRARGGSHQECWFRQRDVANTAASVSEPRQVVGVGPHDK